LYRNETTRHANLILPTSFGLERDHFDLTFYLFAVRNAARYVKPLVPAPGKVRPDFEVLLDLANAVRRFGGGRAGKALSAAWWLAQKLGDRRLLDLLLRFGPYRLSLRKLQKSPHGLDLGSLQPQLPARLCTNDGRLQLAPEIFVRDLD